MLRNNDFRIVFLGIANRDASYLERVLNILSKESPKQVFVSLSPYFMKEENLSTYENAEEIDTAMVSRFRGKTNFKVGQSQRIIYERVTGLKLPNINQSILYNFSSEGAFSDMGIPVTLFTPPVEESIKALDQQIKSSERNIDRLHENIKVQKMLDKLHYVSDVVNVQGCPQCKQEKILHGPNEISPPYINHVSSKLLSTRFQTDLAGLQIRRSIDEMVERRKSQETKGKSPTFVVFTDLAQFDMYSLARSIMIPKDKPQFDGASDDYFKLRAMFGDLDLEPDTPSLTQSLEYLNSSSEIKLVLEEQERQTRVKSRSCFVDKIIAD